DGLRQDLEEKARLAIKTRLVLNAVAKAEGIKVTPEELDKEIDDLSAQYNVEADKIRADLEASNQLSYLEESLLFDKVQDFLADNAVVVTEEPEQEERGGPEETLVEEGAHQETGQEETPPSEEA
ncbi:MAG: hypothetical protein WBI44_08065, partial [Syntrophaceticus sp.]